MNRVGKIAVFIAGCIALASFADMQKAYGQTKAAQAGTQSVDRRNAQTWRAKVRQELPLLGHRNWILIVDSAYPLQTSPGVETVETGSTMTAVTEEVLHDLEGSVHVHPIVYMDAELPYLSDKSAPRVTRYRHEMQTLLAGRAITALPHEQIIGRIDEAGKVFHVLVLKTTLAIPYTSVFLQLDCKYWSAASEAELRKEMKADGK